MTSPGPDIPYHGLPPEIMSEICASISDDYRALFNLGLANKLMHDLSLSLLYRSMYSIFDAQSKSRKTCVPRNSNRAMRSLLNNLELATYVQEYTIEDPKPESGLSSSPLQNLRRGLYAMINLKYLTIETFSPDRWKLLFHFDSPFLAPPILFQLETFACKGNAPSLACTTFYTDLSAFLQTQHKLRRIDVQLASRDNWEYGWFQKMGGILERDAQAMPFPPSCCPQLEWVIGNRAAIEALLPGRKVRILQWRYSWSDSRGSIRHLARELAHLEVMSIPESGLRGVDPPLVQMAKYMRNLQYLEVPSTDLNSLEWTFTLPSLLGIVLLDSDYRDRHRLIDTPARRKMAANLFDQISTLQFIAVELHSKYLLKNNLELWRRLPENRNTDNPWIDDIVRDPEYVRRAFIQEIIYPSI